MTFKFFKSYSEKEVIRVEKKYLKTINKLEDTISKLSDEELQNKTVYFKNLLSNGKTLEDILPEAFAVCREASKRVLNMRHFDVQLIGGVILHQGRIAEMKTGEGKTLVATLPAYLNALTGKGVHVITVNDYLAQRDLETMKPLYDFLGVSCGVITSKTSKEEKKKMYNKDITYITNSELGFDYLKDNMVYTIEEKCQRPFYFALIDEVDSILIDEARTPLIISRMQDKSTEMYTVADVFVKTLKDDDYERDEKLQTVVLSQKGIEKAEKIFGLSNYGDIENNELQHHIKQALYANIRLKKDKDYIVKDGEVVLIDEHTGRIAKGRRYSNGLHQAIEAKEGVEIKQETCTLATITYQNFFKMYEKVSGMTGTGETEQKEFNEIYGLDVVVIPTNRPVQRIDNLDKLYMTEKAKINGIIEDIIENYNRKRPVLVGTPSIEKSEQLSEILNKKGIPHQVLNAKRDDLEAEIVANAGQLGSVTIATNMAGRGTDIKLGEGVSEIGGLKVIGTERADNRRIDNQLRGRSGRQGDAGESQFYTSFEDGLMAFATEKFNTLIDKSDKNDTKPIANKMLNSIIAKCQKMKEDMHFKSRKSVTDYDEIDNCQREVIYKQRNEVLGCNEETITNYILSMINTSFSNAVSHKLQEELGELTEEEENEKINNLIKFLEPAYFEKGTFSKKEFFDLGSNEKIAECIIEKAKEILYQKKKVLEENFTQVVKNIVLTNVDNQWRNHIEMLHELKRNVKLVAFKQIDPLQEYSVKSYELIDVMSYNIISNSVKEILNIPINSENNIEELIGGHGDNDDECVLTK